ncbi:MAG: acetyltransferase [Chloroflexota bacterium]
MDKIKIIGLGAGGHARVIIEILRLNPQLELIGLLDTNQELHGKLMLGVPILGDDTLLPDLTRQGLSHFFIGLGGVGNTNPRRRLYEIACNQNLLPCNAIHPSAILSPSAQIGLGFSAMANSVVNACVTIGVNVILNTGAIIEHDCVIGNHVHIATGARLTSTVRAGNGVHIGAGAVIRQCISIGENAVIGAGAVVVKNVPANVTVVGVPAGILKR